MCMENLAQMATKLDFSLVNFWDNILDFVDNITQVTNSTITMSQITIGYANSVSTLVLGSFSNITFVTNTSANAPEVIADVQYDINNITSWETNIHEVNTTDTHSNITTETVFSLDPDSTCTTTIARTNIIYTMKSNNGEVIPDWIKLNATSGKYEGTAPLVKNETVYSFILNSTWTTYPAGSSEQVVKFTIIPIPPTIATVSLGGAAAGAGVSVINSVVSGNPPTGIYFILHQLQMIILFLMIDAFIPETLQTYLEGQGFALVNFNFIPSGDIPGFDLPITWMNGNQTNQVLKSLGIDSRSTFVNNASLFVTIGGIIILHLILRFVFV